MKIVNHTIVSLRDMLVLDGEKIVDVENNIVNVLPAWISKIGSKVLKEELEHYLIDVRAHQKDLINYNKNNNSMVKEDHSTIVKAYITETNNKLSACADARIADACLINAIQAINHYKINIYGTLAAYADSLGQKNAAEIYHNAMIDEKVADMRLSNIAERNVNVFAKVNC